MLELQRHVHRRPAELVLHVEHRRASALHNLERRRLELLARCHVQVRVALLVAQQQRLRRHLLDEQQRLILVAQAHCKLQRGLSLGISSTDHLSASTLDELGCDGSAPLSDCCVQARVALAVGLPQHINRQIFGQHDRQVFRLQSHRNVQGRLSGSVFRTAQRHDFAIQQLARHLREPHARCQVQEILPQKARLQTLRVRGVYQQQRHVLLLALERHDYRRLAKVVGQTNHLGPE